MKRCPNCSGNKREKDGRCFYCGGQGEPIRDKCDPAYADCDPRRNAYGQQALEWQHYQQARMMQAQQARGYGLYGGALAGYIAGGGMFK